MGVVAVHHSGAVVDLHHDMGINAAAEMCLAVFTAAGTTLAAAGLAVLALGRWRPTFTLLPVGVLAALEVPVAKARHGPAAASVLCVSRR